MPIKNTKLRELYGEFQILCYNCNFGKGDQAECPHALLRRQQGAA